MMTDPWGDVRATYGQRTGYETGELGTIRNLLADADAMLAVVSVADQADWDLVMEFWATQFPPHNEGLRIFGELRDALASLPEHLKGSN